MTDLKGLLGTAHRALSVQNIDHALIGGLASAGWGVQPEDLIGLKIQAYMNSPKRVCQDKADIAAVIRNNPELDWTRIKQYADLFGEWGSIEQVREST